MRVRSNETESSRHRKSREPISKLGDLWWKGPTWLSIISLWPRRPTIGPTTESQVEFKGIKEIMATTIEKSATFDKLLEKHKLMQVLKNNSLD